MKMKRPTEVKGPTEVNFKHSGGQKIFARFLAQVHVHYYVVVRPSVVCL